MKRKVKDDLQSSIFVNFFCFLARQHHFQKHSGFHTNNCYFNAEKIFNTGTQGAGFLNQNGAREGDRLLKYKSIVKCFP